MQNVTFVWLFFLTLNYLDTMKKFNMTTFKKAKDIVKHNMKKKEILIISYSQSGQLYSIVDNIIDLLVPLKNVNISNVTIKPKKDYPFPWSTEEFFDAFPESVSETPCELEPIKGIFNKKYDLIIFAYQTWFLSPSIPSMSFLNLKDAKKIFNDTPVVTINGCRNMWVMGHESVKNKIGELGGNLVGNIVLADKAANLISVITILYWMLTGKKDRFLKIFPKPGVSEFDIQDSKKFGSLINDALQGNDYSQLQSNLTKEGAVFFSPLLTIIEIRAKKILFKKFTQIIQKKGKDNPKKRILLLKIFKYYLAFALFVVSPIVTTFYLLMYPLFLFKIKKLKKAYMY